MPGMKKFNFVGTQVALAFFVITPYSANAAVNLSFQCQKSDAGAQMSIHYAAETLTVIDEHGTSSLAGFIQGDVTGIFTLSGTGAMSALMPDAMALDLCVAANLKAQAAPATDIDALAYASNACRLKLTPAGSIQNVQAQLTLTSIDKGKAMLFLQRQYMTPSAVTGKPLQRDELPVRNCEVINSP